MPSSGFHSHCLHTVHRPTCRQNPHTHNNKHISNKKVTKGFLFLFSPHQLRFIVLHNILQACLSFVKFRIILGMLLGLECLFGASRGRKAVFQYWMAMLAFHRMVLSVPQALGEEKNWSTLQIPTLSVCQEHFSVLEGSEQNKMLPCCLQNPLEQGSTGDWCRLRYPGNSPCKMADGHSGGRGWYDICFGK